MSEVANAPLSQTSMSYDIGENAALKCCMDLTAITETLSRSIPNARNCCWSNIWEGSLTLRKRNKQRENKK